MVSLRSIVAASALALVANLAPASASQAAQVEKPRIGQATELSSAKVSGNKASRNKVSSNKHVHHRRVARPQAAPRYSAYRWGGADPSIGPDGRPYQVPPYLRNQCYIDEGYGRFSACPIR